MMKEDTKDINEIIIRYLDGSAELEEKILLLQWLKQSNDNRDEFFATRDLWLSCNYVAENELEVDIALEKLRHRILQEHKENGHKSLNAKRLLPVVYKCTRIAALFLLLLGIGYFIGCWMEHSSSEVILQKQLITAKGSKGRFMLPDGSLVWLNSDTKLTYPSKFEGDKRIVTLDGEAYFEVAKDEKKPFIVHTGDIEVEVLGTCFDLDSYCSGEFIETALISGSVKITRKSMKDAVYLKPNKLFRYSKSDHVVSVEDAKVGLYADWIKDRLVFDNDCLADILISMKGRYNLDIECPKVFADSTRLSFTIRQESIEEVMEAMRFIAPIRYEMKNGKIYIIPKSLIENE